MISAQGSKKTRFAGLGLYGAIHVCGEQAGNGLFLLEANDRGLVSIQHRNTVHGASGGAVKNLPIQKHVEGDVVGVRPNAQLRVVGKIVAEGEGVAMIRSRGIAGSRDGDTLLVRLAADDELSQYPAVCDLVVLHDGIAVIEILAGAAEAGPDGVSRCGSRD
jgi:hypothetical protein